MGNTAAGIIGGLLGLLLLTIGLLAFFQRRKKGFRRIEQGLIVGGCIIVVAVCMKYDVRFDAREV